MNDRQIHAEVEIDAPPHRVWDVLTAFDDYERWNPFLFEARGEARAGETLEIRVDLPRQAQKSFHPRVAAARPGRELTWVGRLVLPGLFDGEHSFLIEPLDDGRRSLLIQHQNFRGLLVPLLSPDMEQAARSGFEAMNEALKREAETVEAAL